MKQKFSIIAFIVTVLIMIIGYFAYTKFVSPIYLNHESRNLNVTLTTPKTIAIAKEIGQKDIFSLELEITGSATGITDIIVSNGESAVHTIALKGGEIDYIYKSDWYSDSCFLYFEGRDQSTAKLNIEYRFLGLN